MKVIDLLTKIAKGEEVPEKIKYENIIWILNSINDTYDNGEQCFFEDYIEKKYVITDILNDEIEIVEDMKIKKLPPSFYENACLTKQDVEVANKINEIIDKINKMEDKQ